MIIKIEITTEGAAFEDDGPFELQCIMRRLSELADAEDLRDHVIRDSNGNTCGKVEVEES